MVSILDEEQLLDPEDAEASAMWSYPALPVDTGQEPYMRSAAEFLAGDLSESAGGTAIGFVEGQHAGIVRIAAASQSTVHVIVEISNGGESRIRRLEATVRASWLRRVTEGAAGGAEEAGKIAAALENLAALPGQSTVRVRMLADGAV